ncbi:MAG: phage baseplate protein, partial [Coleofasciculus sp. C2-GNP5-27]
RLELNFQVDDIRITPSPEYPEELSVNSGEWDVRFRLPNSSDLLAIAAYSDPTVAQQVLLKSCLLSVGEQGEVRSVNQLPASAIEAVVAKMAEADPQADVQLALSCPACAHQWQSAFDIVSFFWSEIDAWAKRTLWEVHTLAYAYSWREADILAMSFRRRKLYLEMVGL